METYHVRLTKPSGETKGFMLVSPTADTWYDISPFAQKVSSGPAGMGDLTPYSAEGWQDWSHGFGIDRMFDIQGYEHAEGSIDTRHGVITAFTKKQEVTAPSTGWGRLVKAVDYEGYTFLATTKGLFLYDPVTDTVTRLLTGSINAMFNEGTYLLVAPEGRRVKRVKLANGSITTKNDGSADTGFGSSVAGNGTATIPYGLYAKLYGAADSDGAILVSDSAIGTSFYINTRLWANSIKAGGDAYLSVCSDKATAPTVGTAGTAVIYVYQTQTDGDIRVCYQNSSNVKQYWNEVGQVWGASETVIAGTVGSCYEVIIHADGTNWHIHLNDTDGVELAETSTVAWANTKAVAGSLWFYIGDGSTAGDYCDLRVEHTYIQDTTQATTTADGNWGAAGSTEASGVAPSDIGGFAMFGGWIWYWDEGTNQIHWTNDTDTMEGSAAAALLTEAVGPGNVPIANLASYRNIYVLREDGIWTMVPVSGDDYSPYASANYKDVRSSANFSAVVPWRGYLFFDVIGRFVQYKDDLEIDRTPPATGVVWPKNEFGDIHEAFAKGDYIYVLASDSSYYTLICYNGSYWNFLHRIGSTTDYAWVGGLSYSVQNARMFLGTEETGGTQHIYYIRFRTNTEHPYPLFGAGDTGIVYSSITDAGWPWIPKSYRSVKARTTGCDSDDYILVEYAADGNIALGSFTPITGTAATSRVTTSPVQEILFPVNTTGTQMQFRWTVHITGTTATPAMEEFILAYILRPPTVRSRQVTVMLGGEVETMGGREQSYYKTQETFLWECRDSVAPITYTDLHGDTYTVYLNGVRIISQEIDKATSRLLKRVQLNLIEVDT